MRDGRPVAETDVTTPVRILIADDHELVRQGMRAILDREPDWVVCGEATTGRQALAKAFELRPDIMILDLGLPEMNGVEVTRRVRRSLPVAVLIVTVHDADQVVQEAIDAGASGYVLKADAGRTLADAVRAILRHDEFISERVRAAVDLRIAGRSAENAAQDVRASDVTRARGAAVAGGGPGQQGDRGGARHHDENGGNAPGADHGEAGVPLDVRTGALRHPQPHHRTLVDRLRWISTTHDVHR